MGKRTERTAVCAVCGREFTTTMSNSRYCSSTCRVRAHRRRARGAAVLPDAAPVIAPPPPDLVDAVGYAHRASNDLARIAAAIADALGREGW